MIGKKWMLALSCAALLAAPAAGFAFGHTTVVADPRLGGSVPYIDGLRETYLQNNVNGILRSGQKPCRKRLGKVLAFPMKSLSTVRALLVLF